MYRLSGLKNGKKRSKKMSTAEESEGNPDRERASKRKPKALQSHTIKLHDKMKKSKLIGEK